MAQKFIRQGEKNAVKYADEIIVLSKGVHDYFKDTYGRETHFIPNGVNRQEIKDAKFITEKIWSNKGFIHIVSWSFGAGKGHSISG